MGPFNSLGMISLSLFQQQIDPGVLPAYFQRIGFSDQPEITLSCLKSLHALHPQSIPFENLNPFLGIPVDLGLNAIWQKLVTDIRGGYCFEHNLLFGNVLRSLGFEVRGLSARVFWEVPEGEIKPRDHMLLLVGVEGKRYIADVGFGGLSLTAPLELDLTGVQNTLHEPYRLSLNAGFYYLEIQIKGEWRLMYRFSLEEQLLPDYQVVSWYLCNHVDSIFTKDLMVARSTPWGRYALIGNRFSTYHLDGSSEKKDIGSVEQIKEVLQKIFLINLPAFPEMDQRLSGLLASN